MDGHKNIYQNILESQLTAILVIDAKFVLKYANPAATHILGISLKKAKNSSIKNIFNYTKLSVKILESVIYAGASFTDSDVVLVSALNVRHTFEISVSPVNFADKVDALIELRLMDKQRQISQEIYLQAQHQASKELVRGLAHEIKNPLGGLRGAAQLLEKMLPNRELTEYTKIIIEQADRLRNLVDRLLGPQKVSLKKPTNIHFVLEKVKQLIELDKRNEINIIRDYDPSIPDLRMDQEQMQQSLLNIVSNAAQAVRGLDNPQIILKTRTQYQTIVQGQIFKLAARIDIIDNGSGIADNIKDTIFYPLVTTKKDGTGLGLSIAQKLIHQHNGKIEVNSWPGETIFTIYLPIKTQSRLVGTK